MLVLAVLALIFTDQHTTSIIGIAVILALLILYELLNGKSKPRR